MLLLLCMLLVVNHCKSHSGVTNFDFSRGYQNNILKNNKKTCEFCTAFLNNFSRHTTVPVFTRWHSTGRYS